MSHYIYRLFINFLLIHYFIYRLVRWSDPQYTPQWVNVLYDQRMTTALIGRLTHHVELILFSGVNNRLRESSINETLSKINSQNG